MKILVRGFEAGMPEGDLRKLFDPFGSIVTVTISGLGFAIVEMADKAQGENAIRGLDGSHYAGQRLLVGKCPKRDAAVIFD